jgi:hypothetical protein
MEPPKTLDETESAEQRVKLNVGGKVFETYRSTLKVYPNTLLGSMFTSSEKLTEKKTEFFFDRDPTLFPMIMNYYRNGYVELLRDVSYKIMESELNFWQIPLPDSAEAFGITKDFLIELTKNNNKETKEKKLFEEKIKFFKKEKTKIKKFLSKLSEDNGKELITKNHFLESVKELDKGIKNCEDTINSMKKDDVKKRDRIVQSMENTRDNLLQFYEHIETQLRIMGSIEEALSLENKSIKIPEKWTRYDKSLRFSYLRDYHDETDTKITFNSCIFIPFMTLPARTHSKESLQVLDPNTIIPPYKKDYDYWTNIVGKERTILYYAKPSDSDKDDIDELYADLLLDCIKLCTSYSNIEVRDRFCILEVYWGEKSGKEQLKDIIEKDLQESKTNKGKNSERKQYYKRKENKDSDSDF